MMTNIDFLKAVLNKQFELVGCETTTDEVINMDAEKQMEFWKSYKITQSQHDAWKQYFMELAPENEEFSVIEDPELLNSIIETVFDTLSAEWEFEIIEADADKTETI